MAHCKTEGMVADVITKVVDSELHEKHAVNISGFGDVYMEVLGGFNVDLKEFDTNI